MEKNHFSVTTIAVVAGKTCLYTAILLAIICQVGDAAAQDRAYRYYQPPQSSGPSAAEFQAYQNRMNTASSRSPVGVRPSPQLNRIPTNDQFPRTDMSGQRVNTPPVYSTARAPGVPTRVATMPQGSYGQDRMAPPEPKGYREARLRNSPALLPRAKKLPARRKPYESPIAAYGRMQEVQNNPFGEIPEETPFSTAPGPRPGQEQGNPFGEQIQNGDPFGERTQQPQDPNNNPFGERPGNQDPQNPFGERPQPDPNSPRSLQDLDPSPNTPPMDTPSIPPKLPSDGRYTPEPGQIPDLPTPDGGTNPNNDGRLPDEVVPGDSDDPQTGEGTGREPTLANPGTRGTGQNLAGRERLSQPAQRFLPAPNPTYYSKPVDPRGLSVGYGDAAKYAYANQGLPGPYGYTGMMNPYAAMAQGYQNPAMANVPPGSCAPGCMPMQMCQAYTAMAMNPAAFNPAMVNPLVPAVAPVAAACNSCGPAPVYTPGVNVQPMAQSICPPTYPTLASTGSVCNTGCQPTVASSACVDPCDPCGGSPYNSILDEGLATCYISLFGGLSRMNDLIARDREESGTYFDDSGYVLGGAIGQIQGRNLRMELEVSYRSFDINGLTLNGAGGLTEGVDLTGSFATLSGMANAYWEFVDFPSGQFKPYVGAGVGFLTAYPDFALRNGSTVMTNDHESSLAYQWMVGVNYRVERQTDLFVEYRYLRADSLSLNTNVVPTTTAGNGSGKIDHVADNIFFGLRMRF